MKAIRILIVDDNRALLDLIARHLTAQQLETRRLPHLEIMVVARAFSGKEAIEKIAEWDPALVLMDIAMPGMNGFETAREIKALPVPPRVLLYSFNDTPEYRRAALDAGADGFVSKTDFWNDVMPHIRRLFSAAPPADVPQPA